MSVGSGYHSGRYSISRAISRKGMLVLEIVDLITSTAVTMIQDRTLLVSKPVHRDSPTVPWRAQDPLFPSVLGPNEPKE